MNPLSRHTDEGSDLNSAAVASLPLESEAQFSCETISLSRSLQVSAFKCAAHFSCCNLYRQGRNTLWYCPPPPVASVSFSTNIYSSLSSPLYFLCVCFILKGYQPVRHSKAAAHVHQWQIGPTFLSDRDVLTAKTNALTEPGSSSDTWNWWSGPREAAALSFCCPFCTKIWREDAKRDEFCISSI